MLKQNEGGDYLDWVDIWKRVSILAKKKLSNPQKVATEYVIEDILEKELGVK